MVIASSRGRMKGPKQSIAFTTKGGKEISFSSGSSAKSKIGKAHIKQLEKRLSAMEKAVLKYNNAIQNSQAKKVKALQVSEQQDGKGARKEVKLSKGAKPVATVARGGARDESTKGIKVKV